jgi:chaperonin GroEL (HSP60 family)
MTEERNGQGFNVFTGKTMDALKEGIIEPLKIKTQAISSASEVAIMILRIDDVIASGPAQGPGSQGLVECLLKCNYVIYIDYLDACIIIN